MKVMASTAMDLGYCVAGMRKVCEKHGWDFKTFVREGLESEDLLRVDDDMIRALVAAQAEKDGHGR